MRRRLLLAVAASGILYSCGEATPRRNVILLVADTLRADHLGAYGHSGPISPHLDELAAESVVFEHCYAQSPWTKPSMATMLTSLYPQVHGVVNYDGNYPGETSAALQRRTGVLSERAVTLAEALRDAGYATAAFISNIWLLAKYGYGQGFALYHEEPAQRRQIDGEALTGPALAWLQLRAPERPFFLYLHFMDVHAPYRNPSREDFEALVDRRSPGARRLLDELPTEQWPNLESRPEWATNDLRREVAYWRARYAAGVLAFDRRIGFFLDELRSNGLLDDSYLVFTSDHGEELHDHGGWTHGRSLFDHQLHVPLMVRLPGGQDGGRRLEGIVELVDLMPTLLSLVGAPAPPGQQGRDLGHLLDGSENVGRIAFATATSTDPDLFAVRTDQHKLVLNARTGEARLFNVLRDPGERREVAALEWGALRRLRSEFARHLSHSVAGGALDSEPAGIPEDVQSTLESLGYLN